MVKRGFDFENYSFEISLDGLNIVITQIEHVGGVRHEHTP